MSQQHQVRVTFGYCSFFGDLLCFLYNRLSFTMRLMVVGTWCHVIGTILLGEVFELLTCLLRLTVQHNFIWNTISCHLSSVSWLQYKPSGHTTCRSQRNLRNNLRSPCNSCGLSPTGRWKFWPNCDLERRDWWASLFAVLCWRTHTFCTLRWNRLYHYSYWANKLFLWRTWSWDSIPWWL